MKLSKAEMIEAIDKMECEFSGEGPGPTHQLLLLSLKESRERLKELAGILQQVELRQLSAAAIVELLRCEGGAA
jgi:hypothetical protein